MTLECCNRMAAELWESQSMLDEFAKAYEKVKISNFGPDDYQEIIYYGKGRNEYIFFTKGILVFHKDSGKLVYSDYPGYFGFSSQYEIPQSKTTDNIKDFRMSGYSEEFIQRMIENKNSDVQKYYPGLYPTRMDLNGLFGIGQEYGKRKLLGYKTSAYQYSYNNQMEVPNPEQGATRGPMTKGMISGQMVRDDYGNKVIWGKLTKTENGRTRNSMTWLKAIPSPTFSGADRFAYPNDTKLKLTKQLPTTPQNFAEMVFSIKGDNRTYSFANQIQYHVKYNSSEASAWELRKLCIAGNMSLRLSKYNDILTNEEHQYDYIELCRTTEIELPSDDGIREGTKVLIDSPPKTVPLKKGVTYYFYIIYENGCCDKSSNRYPVQFASLVATKSSRLLKWPSSERTISS